MSRFIVKLDKSFKISKKARKKKKYQYRKFVDVQNIFSSGFDRNFTKKLLMKQPMMRGKTRVQVILSASSTKGKKIKKKIKKKEQPKKVKKKKTI